MKQNSPSGRVLRIVAGERLVVDHLALSTGDDTRVSVDAGHQTTALTDVESGEGVELGRDGTGVNLVGALEANNGWNQ